MGAAAIKSLAAHLLGRTGLLGQRKALQLACIAAGTTVARNANVEWLFRVIR